MRSSHTGFRGRGCGKGCFSALSDFIYRAGAFSKGSSPWNARLCWFELSTELNAENVSGRDMPHRQGPFFSTEGVSCSITLKERFFALLTRFFLPLCCSGMLIMWVKWRKGKKKIGKGMKERDEEDREGRASSLKPIPAIHRAHGSGGSEGSRTRLRMCGYRW